MTDFFDACAREFDDARRRFRETLAPLEEPVARRRPAPGAWSVAECVDHLHHSLSLYDAQLAPCLEAARSGDAEIGRGTVVGRLLMWVLDPTREKVRRVKVPRQFAPGDEIDWSALVAAYPAMCDRWLAHVDAARELPVGRLRLATPVSRWLKVSAAQALAINAAHQGRHLDQAERALRAVQTPRA